MALTSELEDAESPVRRFFEERFPNRRTLQATPASSSSTSR